MLRCVAVDDEPMALSVISNFCGRIGNIDLTVFTDPEAAVRMIEENHPDLVFLDIEMGTVNGMDLARRLPEDTCVILTTAYKQYALEGYDIGVIDFLHKPFSFSRFELAVNKARKVVEYIRSRYDRQDLVVKEEYMNVSIPFSDILYIEAQNNYCSIYRRDGVCTNSRISLKSLIPSLPSREFVRVHRSFVVSKSKIERYTKKEVRLLNGQIIPVGRQYSDVLPLL